MLLVDVDERKSKVWVDACAGGMFWYVQRERAVRVWRLCDNCIARLISQKQMRLRVL